MIFAIDPGPTNSAFVRYVDGAPHSFGYLENVRMLLELSCDLPSEHLAVEMIASYGMPVGADVFETCVWIGRFIEAWGNRPYTLVYRKDVKMHLCQSNRAKDGNVRQAIIDRFEPTGGGRCPQIGTKAKQGPLYGITGDVWAALGVAMTFDETREVVSG